MTHQHEIKIVVISFVIYITSLQCGFVFDDVSAIIDNKDLRHVPPPISSIHNCKQTTDIYFQKCKQKAVLFRKKCK